MTEIHLTRVQVEQLAKIIEKDKKIDGVTISVTHTSGIGPSVHVKYTKVKDITDVESW